MYEHKPNNLVACICEGNAELEIMELLLEHNRLKFTEDDLLDDRLFTKLMRSAKNLEMRYLSQNYEPNQKVEIIRIIDSRAESYLIRGAYKSKVEGEIVNCYTRPEIEMLVILNEGKYDQFKRSKKKPSEYCIHDLKMGKNIKNKGFISDYFYDIDDLLNALKEYHQRRPNKNEDTIYSLLKYRVPEQ